MCDRAARHIVGMQGTLGHVCVNTGEGLMAAQRFGAAAALPAASHKAAGFFPVPCCCAALQTLMIEAQQHAVLCCAVLCCAVLCCAALLTIQALMIEAQQHADVH